LHARIACRRHDWSNALFDGRIDEPAMDFTPDAHLGLEALLDDPPRFDFIECGLVNYYWARSQGAPIRALPVFLRAAFRHSYIFVNEAVRVDHPRDLEGKRVGTRYGMTANVWARALLGHQHGVQLEKIHWLNQETRTPAPYALPPGLVLEPVAKDVDLRDLLAQGKIDALVHPDVLATHLLAHPNVKRLFSNAAAAEREYYRATGIVPVMNVIVFRESDLNDRSETVKAVFGAFCRAKSMGLEAMQDVRDSGLLWYYESLEEQLALVGPDPAPYSLAKMERTLAAFVAYGLEQGVFTKALALDELFWEEPA
jgi:4,5-dihydroxyphthalate decarboxylase